MTEGSVERAREEEERLDRSLLERVVRDRDVVDLRALSRSELAATGLFVDELLPRHVVIDTRDRQSYRRWHPDGADHRPFEDLRTQFDELDREATYVLLCEQGTTTAHLAEEMQRAGYEAYSYRGGTARLRRREEETEEGGG